MNFMSDVQEEKMKASALSADQGERPEDAAKAPERGPRRRLRRPERRYPDVANGKGSGGTCGGYGESTRRYGRRSPRTEPSSVEDLPEGRWCWAVGHRWTHGSGPIRYGG